MYGHAILICEQRNGERIHLEAWVYWSWLHGGLTDPLLTRPIREAVQLRWA